MGRGVGGESRDLPQEDIILQLSAILQLRTGVEVARLRVERGQPLVGDLGTSLEIEDAW